VVEGKAEPLEGWLAGDLGSGMDYGGDDPTAGLMSTEGGEDDSGWGSAQGVPDVIDPTGKYTLVKKGAFTAVNVTWNENIPGSEGFKSEAGAMVSMSRNTDIDARMDPDCQTACCRCCCAGESCCTSYYSNVGGGINDVLIAPSLPGEIVLINIDSDRPWRVQKGSYLASDNDVTVAAVFNQDCCGAALSGEGLFVLKASCEEGKAGRLLVNSYGSILRYDLGPGESRFFDNGVLVAWEDHLQYVIGFADRSGAQGVGGMMGRMATSFLSGEGIGMTFTGPGTIYVQTRSIQAFILSLIPHLPPSKVPQAQD